MATKVAELRADLTLNSASFESSAQKARREFRQFQQSVQADTSAMQKSLASITGLFKGLAVGAVAAFGTAGIAGAIGMAIKEFKDSEQALLRLQGVLKATGNTTGLTAKQIDDLSNAMEATTLATDDMVKAAAARLATFGTVAGTNFKRTIQLANDLSAVFGGDLVAATEKIGNALNNPVQGLKLLTREVRAFSPEVAESAKQLFEMGRAAEAQTLILDELAKSVGGAAGAEAGGLTGKFDQLSKTFANVGAQILEQTGLIQALIGTIQLAGDTINAIAGPATTADVLNSKAAELNKLREQLTNPAASMATSPEEEEQRKAAIIARIGVLKQEVETIIAGMDAEKERAAIAAKALSDKANASQITYKAEIKNIAEATTGEKTKGKVVIDLIEERRKREAFAASEREKQRAGELASILAAYEEDKRVALAVEQQKQKAAEDATREAERIAQQNADIFAEPFKEAARQIQDAVASALRMGMEGEITTAKDVAETIKNIFFQMASQVATLAIFNPSALSGLGGGGTLGQLAPSLLGGTALGGVGVGGLLTSGALGAAAGGIGAGLFGLNSTGGSIGGGLGAAAGFALGGPLGALAGGALGSIGGGLLGGVFGGGGGTRNNNYRASFVNGEFVGVSNTKPDQQNVDAITGVQQQIAALYQIIQQGGGSFAGTLGFNAGNRDGLQLSTADGTRNFGSTSALSLAAARALIAGSEGVSALDRRIAGRSQATDAAGLAEDLQFARTFHDLTGAVTPFVAELRNMQREMEKGRDKAKELGLNVGDLNRAYERQIDTIRAQKSAQIVSLQSGFRGAVDSAFSFAEPIDALRAELGAGGTARSRLGSSRAEFERVRRLVEAGRVEGFQALPDVAQNLLGAARENFASGSGYAEIAALVRQVLDSADAQIDAERDPLLEGIGQNTQTLKDLGDTLGPQQEQLIEQVKGLRRDIRALDRAA